MIEREAEGADNFEVSCCSVELVDIWPRDFSSATRLLVVLAQVWARCYWSGFRIVSPRN